MPGATLSIQWGDDHVWKVGSKMFAVLRAPEAKQQSLSFKAGDDSFAILTQQPGIVPAPYLARAHALVAARLTKKARAALGV